MKLPTYQTLGQTPVPEAPTSIVQYDPTGPFKALAEQGAEIQKDGSDLKELVDKSTVNDAYMTFNKKLNDAANQYYSLQGNDAVKGLKPFQDQVASFKDEAMGGVVGTDATTNLQHLLEYSSDRHLYGAALHADDQGRKFAATTHSAMLSNLLDDTADNFQNPKIVDANRQNGIAEIQGYGAQTGSSPDMIEQQIRSFNTNLDNTRKTAAISSISSSPPSQQMDMLRPIMQKQDGEQFGDSRDLIAPDEADKMYKNAQSQAKISARISDQATQQQQQNTMGDYVQQAAAGTLSSNAVAVDSSLKPEQRQQILDVQEAIAARGMPNDFGPSFNQHAGKIYSGIAIPYEELLPKVASGDLNVSGATQLKKMSDMTQSQAGLAELKTQNDAVQDARSQIVKGAPGADFVGEKNFDSFVNSFYPKWDAARASNIPPEELNNPKSPNYINKDVGSYTRTDAQAIADVTQTPKPSAIQPPSDTDVGFLKAHPEKAVMFDKRFGNGASLKILGNQ